MNHFFSLTSEKIVSLASRSKSTLIYVAPGLFSPLAEQIVGLSRHGSDVKVIIDGDPEVCRLGYGEIEAVQKLVDNKISVFKSKGLRLGLLVIDDEAWVFSPTPILVDDEPNGHSVNSIKVTREQALGLVKELAPSPDVRVAPTAARTTAHQPVFDGEQINRRPDLVIDLPTLLPQEPYKVTDLKKAQSNLELCPPQKFELAKRVRVYESLFQFVELHLRGCHLTRHTIAIPARLMAFASNNEEVQSRLKTTYKLISDSKSISTGQVQEKVNKLRKELIRPLGEKYGAVVLRSQRQVLDREVEKLRTDISKIGQNLEKKLEKQIERCRNELIKALLPALRRNPPQELQYAGSKPSTDTLKAYLEYELSKEIKPASHYITEMRLDCVYKNATYEMLQDPRFKESVEIAYPFIQWSELFREDDAVKAEQLQLRVQKG